MGRLNQHEENCARSVEAPKTANTDSEDDRMRVVRMSDRMPESRGDVQILGSYRVPMSHPAVRNESMSCLWSSVRLRSAFHPRDHERLSVGGLRRKPGRPKDIPGHALRRLSPEIEPLLAGG